ncbi:MAG: NusG domain II-containing protein [Clostridia bacterium]
MKILKKRDVWTIILLAFICVTIYFIFYAGTGNIAIIEKNGTIIYKIDLSKVKNEYVIKLDDEYNVEILVKNGGICFQHSNCHDKICEKFGTINKKGQIAVCLPAKVSVRITGESEYDGITG